MLRIACLLSLVCFPLCLSAGEWPQWRGPLRTGAAADSPALIESLPEAGLKPLWQSGEITSARGGGWGAPVVADGVVFLFSHRREQIRELGKAKYPYLPPSRRTGMTDEEFAEYERKRRDENEERGKAYQFREIVYAYDANTGEPKWTNESQSVYTRWPQSGSPAVVDGKLYLLGAGRKARCLDAATGDDLWEVRFPGEFRDEYYQASPLIIDDKMIVMASHLFALSTETGDVVWEGDPQLTSGSHASPIAWEHEGHSHVLANTDGGKTICVDATTGDVQWTVKSDGGRSTPIAVGDLLLTYGGSRQKGLRCFQLFEDRAEPVWEFHGAADKGSSPVVVNDLVFVQGEKRLACVGLKDGARYWSATLDMASPQYTSLIAADGKVFYGYDSILCFAATDRDYLELFNGYLNEDRLLASEATHRQLLNLDALEKEENGLEKSMRLFNSKVGKQGALKCCTPAIANGLLYVRLNDALVCYDLRR